MVKLNEREENSKPRITERQTVEKKFQVPYNILVSAGMCLPTAETAVANTRPKSAITVKVNGIPMNANTYGDKIF